MSSLPSRIVINFDFVARRIGREIYLASKHAIVIMQTEVTHSYVAERDGTAIP